MAEGRRPVMNEKREGAHSGLLQYADRNVMPPAARESRFGVRATAFPYAGSASGVSWSAMSMRKLGFGMSIPLSAAPGPAYTIENDSEQHDHKTGLEADADLHGAEGADHGYAETAGADQSCNHDHREAEHDALIDAREQLGRCARQLDFPQELPGTRADRLSGLAQRPGNGGHSELSHADDRRQSEYHRGDESRHHPESEEHERRNQIEIGRASCRERVEVEVVDVAVKGE